MDKKGKDRNPSLSANTSATRIGSGPEALSSRVRDRTGTERWTRSGPDNDLSDYMATFTVSERYRPAFLSAGKEWMIVYWVRHPDTSAWIRKKEKLNWIKDPVERKRFAKQRLRELNMKLAIGWNPVIDVQAPRSATPLREAMDLFLETKLREQLRPDSERTYRSLLGILAAWLNEQGKLMMAAGTFTEDDAIAFMDRCFAARKISGRTFNNYRGFYGTLCSWLKKHKYMRENPFDMVERKRYDKRRKNRRVLTDDERQRVRVYLQEHQPRFLVFSLLMFHCALRPKEVFYLMPRHFDLERQCITVEASFSKTHYERVVAIPNVLVPELRSLGLDEQDPNDHIFSKGMLPGPALKRSTYSGKFWKRLRDDLGLPAECKHYSLRDTAVLQLARDQVSRLDSMNHFDHHSSDMHDIYGRAREDHGNDEVRQKMSAF